MFFISTAPRPQSIPSLISPPNGSTVQVRGSAGTTSRWPWTTSAGLPGFLPSTRATPLVRPGSESNSFGASPSALNRASTYSAAAISPLDVPSP